MELVDSSKILIDWIKEMNQENKNSKSAWILIIIVALAAFLLSLYYSYNS